MRRLLLITALWCAPANAQVPVSQAPPIKFQFLTNAGVPVANGCLSTFIAGTSTPQATYVDSTGTSQNANPIILDAAGRADIWLPNASFKLVLKTAGGVACASGVQLWSVDGVSGILGLLNLTNVWTGANSFSQAVTITPNTNQIILGVPGNQVTINSPAPAANITLNLPSTADTLVGRATTDTLTNKTLTSPTLTTPVLNGTPTGTSLQGTDTKLLTSGTISGTAAALCTDALGGATTSGCVPPAAAFVGCTAIGPVTVSNTVALSTLLSCSIPANTLSAGSLLAVDLTGIESTASGQTISFTYTLGGGTPCTTSPATLSVANNQPIYTMGKFAVLTAGAGGTANWSCGYLAFAGYFGPNGVVGAPTISINTTISNTLLVQVTMSVANVGNTTTAQLLKSVVF